MKSYVKPNVVVDFLDIETCSSIGEVVFQLSPVFLASTGLADHTLVACETTLVQVLVLTDVVWLAILVNIIRNGTH